jgi:hypothetical protein
MNRPEYELEFNGKESLLYKEGTLHCVMDCFYAPERRMWSVVIKNETIEGGNRKMLDPIQLQKIKDRVRGHLSVKRLFGFPIWKNEVVFLNSQSIEV